MAWDKNKDMGNINPAANLNKMSTNTPADNSDQTDSDPTFSPKETNNFKTDSPGEVKYAGGLRRYAAYSLDSILVGVLGSIIGLPLSIFVNFSSSESLGLIMGLINFIIQLALYVGYYVYFIADRAQTPGKMVFQVKVLKEETLEKPSYSSAFMREILGKFVSTIPLGLGFLWILFDKKKQAWHDKIAGTVAIEDGRLSTGKKILMIIFAAFPIIVLLLLIAGIVLLVTFNPAARLEQAFESQSRFESDNMEINRQMQELQQEIEEFEETNSVPPPNFNEN